MSDVSPLAPAAFPRLPSVAGVRLATHAAGLRYQKRADLMLASMPAGTTVAGFGIGKINHVVGFEIRIDGDI